MLIEMEKDSAVTATNIDDDIMVIMLQYTPFITLCLRSIGILIFDLILYIPSTIFQLNRDGSSWDEPVLS